MRNRRNYRRNSHYLSSFITGIITTLIFFCVTIGLIAVFGKSIILTGNNSLNFTPTLSLDLKICQQYLFLLLKN